jgi:hypothetical protein
MTMEDRVRQLLADAVADEPPPRGAPLERALGRRRPRPGLVGVAALCMILALLAAVAVVRGPGRPAVAPAATTGAPTTTTVATAGWPDYEDQAKNLRLSYPPGWKVRPGPLGDELVPPEYADSRPGRAKYAVTVSAFPGFYLTGYDWRGATRGQLPGGQPYAHRVGYPDLVPGEDPPAPPATAPGRRYAVYMVDLGRFCSTGPKPFCGAHALRVAVYDANARAFDRYRGQLDAIARSVSHLRPATSTTGDAGRPACRPGQWRLAGSRGLSGIGQRISFSGVVRYRAGPACHLRLQLRMTVERDGRPLPVAGGPAVATVGGLLPEDDQRRLNRLGVHDTPLTWRLAVDEWCNQELAGARLRVTAPGGRSLVAALPERADQPDDPGFCRERGRPAAIVGLP